MSSTIFRVAEEAEDIVMIVCYTMYRRISLSCFHIVFTMASLYDRLSEEHQLKINFSYLSRNPSEIHILEANLDKVDWYNLSQNSGLFEINGYLLK